MTFSFSSSSSFSFFFFSFFSPNFSPLDCHFVGWKNPRFCQTRHQPQTQPSGNSSWTKKTKRRENWFGFPFFPLFSFFHLFFFLVSPKYLSGDATDGPEFCFYFANTAMELEKIEESTTKVLPSSFHLFPYFPPLPFSPSYPSPKALFKCSSQTKKDHSFRL